MTARNAGKRSQREDAALAALLSERTIAEAAQTAGIGESTLLRWMAEPDFKRRYQEARRQVLDQAVSRLQQAASDAVDALTSIARDREAPQAARVSAARTVLDQAFRGLEVLDLATRIEQLERGQKDNEAT